VTAHATAPAGVTPRVQARVPETLIDAAKTRNPELHDASDSLLVRVALAVLAGYTVAKALEAVRGKNFTTEKIPDFPGIKSP
jgi:hypothetical protein